VYNALLARRALPFIYVLAPTRRPVECLSLLRRLGGAGCSVTMPAKQAVIPALDELVPGAARTGAVNTVTWHEDRAVGYNTDLAAVRALAGDAMGRRALVLGAGGAARAAAAALQDAGARVAVSGRSDGRAGALARELSCGHVSWAERERARFDLLVNATPCGADGASLPLRPASGWRGATVIDAVLGGRPTPLVREARAGGARTRDGIAWWCEQGARQMELLTGAAWCPDEIEEVARA
jgi:shikimate dehydrogenase